MSPTKRALLVASPYGELQGPTNDVELIASVLEQQSFEITRCCGTQATCKNIRTQWQQLIRKIRADDIAVIYYSGHGGIVQSAQDAQSHAVEDTGAKPWRYQFIVPMDFDRSSEGDFRGILDIELSQLLRGTTDKTRNVTLILDCCHSGRMARQPGFGTQARTKSLPQVYHHDISRYIEKCRSQGRLLEETYLEGNPNAVRITAAAASESAFEYTNPAGKVYGAMTEILASAIREGHGQEVSWRSTLMRVRESVNVNFPQQHPCVEGPDTRLHFSVKHIDIERMRDFVLKVSNGIARLQAGRVAGVHEGNIYAVMPLSSQRVSGAEKIANAVVRNVFSSYAELGLSPVCKIDEIPREGAMALLQYEALPRWPVVLSDDLSEFGSIVADSRYLRGLDNDQKDPPLMRIRTCLDQIVLSTNLEVDIASIALQRTSPSREEFLDILKRAEHLARAQHLLSIQNRQQTALHHNVLVDVGWVEDGKAGKHLLGHNGDSCLVENDRIFIRLANRGKSKVFISVLDINVAGTISLVSASSPRGIELEAGRVYVLGKEQYSEVYRGLKISWPKDVPRSPGVSEWLVFIFSDSPADLRHLENPAIPRSSKHGPISRLEELADWISFGNKRDIERDVEEGTRFTISQVPFLLNPQSVLASALPTPDTSAEWTSLPHGQPITQLTSKTFISPATRKTLPPSSSDQESSISRFPLWTRKEGFGVITIFRGPNKILVIENDRIALGSTAYFTGKPDLGIVKHSQGFRFMDRYNHTDSRQDFSQAHIYAPQMIQAAHSDHPDQAGRLSNLGILSRDRHRRTGSTGDLEPESHDEAPETALDCDQGDIVQMLLDKNISGEALLHNAIRLGRLHQVRCLLHTTSSTPVVHEGVDALDAAYFYAVLEVVKSGCTSASLFPPSHDSWQAVNQRIEICTILEVSGRQSSSGGTAEHNKILQQDLRAVDIPAGEHFVSLYRWEYPEIVKTWRPSSPPSVIKGTVEREDQSAKLTAKMLNTVTVSGYGTCFEAMSCQQYVRKRWGDTGLKVATFLTRAAELVPAIVDDESVTQAQVRTVESVIKLDGIGDRTCEVVAYAFPSYVCLFVRNLNDSQVQEIHEIAQWMCQTFRPLEAVHSGALQMSSVTQPANLCSQADLKAMAYCLQPLRPLEIRQADCWTALFETGIVAETSRSEGSELEGIEMSFDLMTTLAAVETYHYLQHSDTTGGLILLGFFTALVPIRLHHSGAIQWHFEFSETDILRPMDLASTQWPWLFVNAPSELSSRRCFVGLWPRANIMLGVQGTKLDFEDSGLPHRSSVLRPKGLELTAGLSPSGGPIQGVLQGTRTYEHMNTRQRFSCASSYVTALSRLSQAVSLVYDCKTHTGWLVPQMSLLLHLCHAYYARMSITSNQSDPIPWAKPSTDGASAALDAFRGSGDIIVSEVGDQSDDRLLLRQLLVSLNSNLQNTHDTRQSPKKILHWTTGIYLSELQDQIREPDKGSALRTLDLSDCPSINAWLDITQKVDGLLVCKNLDQAIALAGPLCSPPATAMQAPHMHLRAHPTNCSCAKVPEGRGYLIAHAWCLQNVLSRSSPSASKDKITWIQNGKPFDVGSSGPNECIWTHPERVLQSFGKPGPGYACNSSRVNAVDGAVVFGKYDERTIVEWLKRLKLGS